VRTTWAIGLHRHARGEDRAAVFGAPHADVVIVADGAGGMPGGGEAADLAIQEVGARASATVDREACTSALLSIDKVIAAAPMAGETTAVLLTVAASIVCGASAGDSEAWLVRGGVVHRLTEGQHKKRRLGSGRSAPVAFQISLEPGDVFVVATDGLFGAVDEASLLRCVRRATPAIQVDRLLETALAPPGAVDDIAVIVGHSGFGGE
jgi:serine/threonine protein phosphatase PrpC